MRGIQEGAGNHTEQEGGSGRQEVENYITYLGGMALNYTLLDHEHLLN